MNKVKAALRVVAEYLMYNPGTATMIGGWVVLVAAKAGLHVTQEQLYAIAMALLPIVAGVHVGARRAREGRKHPAKSTSNEA